MPYIGWHYLSNTSYLSMASFVVHVVRRVKDHHGLLHSSPVLKKTCVRRVVLDKLFPLSKGKSPRDSEKLHEVLLRACARGRESVDQRPSGCPCTPCRSHPGTDSARASERRGGPHWHWRPNPTPAPELGSTASGRGRDERGRRRSAAIPHSQLSWERVDNMWQHFANCDKHITHFNMWQHVRTEYNIWQNVGICGPSVKQMLSSPRLESP